MNRYATPISGLYLCGSGTHPGGGVMGSPGYLAATTFFVGDVKVRFLFITRQGTTAKDAARNSQIC